MTESCRICNCIAMEHNAVVGKEAKSIGENVKSLISELEYEELTFSHSWLEYPIIEPIATIGFSIAMRDINEKCNIPTDEIKKLFFEAADDNEKRRFGAAQQKFIEVKSKIAELATGLCKGR